MKILFIDSTHPFLYEELTRQGFQCDLNFAWDEQQILTNIHLYDGVVIRSKIKFAKEIIDKAKQIKFIARVGAGMENIDVAYAERKGIKCLHAPEGNRDAVGEHAIGMLLSLFNNLSKAHKEVCEGKWIREGNRGIELAGKTIGIIGYGNMGSAFARKLKGFDVNVLGYDKYLPVLMKGKKNFSDKFVADVPLQKIFEETDVLSLHVPLTDETHYMVNDAFINSFRKNIYLINTSRGKVVKTEDLVKNMKSGKILGACLDVLEYEELSFENIQHSKLNIQNPEVYNYIVNSEKVILTPHIAGWTHESNLKMAEVLVKKILSGFSKK